MTSTNHNAVIPPAVECILCPDCGDNITITSHPNSHGIAGMDDCLYNGQCSNIACQNFSMKKKVFLVCIACQSMSDRSVNGSVTRVTNSIKTTTKHTKSQHHMKSMKYWKKKSLIHEQQQSSIRCSSSDNIDMDLPSSVDVSLNNIHPKTELPGYMLNTLSE